MTAQEILTSNVKGITEADQWLSGRELPAITEAASDKQEALAQSKRAAALRLVVALPATVREGVGADPRFDTERAERATAAVLGEWLRPRTAREWIDDMPSLQTLCNQVLAHYQAIN